MKAVIANPLSFPRGPIGILRQEVLRPDEALEVDCRDIADLVLGPLGSRRSPSLANGFVVIKVSVPLGSAPVEYSNLGTQLEVVVVYTVKSMAPGGIVPTDRPDLLIDPDSRVLDNLRSPYLQSCDDQYYKCVQFPDPFVDCGFQLVTCESACTDEFSALGLR